MKKVDELTWYAMHVVKYLNKDPLRARRIIRAAQLPNVRVGARHKENKNFIIIREKKGEIKSGE